MLVCCVCSADVASIKHGDLSSRALMGQNTRGRGDYYWGDSRNILARNLSRSFKIPLILLTSRLHTNGAKCVDSLSIKRRGSNKKNQPDQIAHQFESKASHSTFTPALLSFMCLRTPCSHTELID